MLPLPLSYPGSKACEEATKSCRSKGNWIRPSLPLHFFAPDFAKCMKRKSPLERLPSCSPPLKLTKIKLIKLMIILFSLVSGQCWGRKLELLYTTLHMVLSGATLPPPCFSLVHWAESCASRQPCSPPLPSSYIRFSDLPGSLGHTCHLTYPVSSCLVYLPL